MKKLIFTVILLPLFASAANAQATVPPYRFETASDYTRYNDAILECCNWMINTPLEEYLPYVDEMVVFIYEWSMGSPDVMILLDPYFMPYYENIPLLMVWHMAGATKYQLERGIYATKVEDIRASTLAGVEAALNCYEQNRELFVTDKATEKLLKARQKGKIEKELVKRIKTDIADEELAKSNHGHVYGTPEEE
ncbi:MAG: hypothetical protein LUF87_07175 [Alistipes sp.]|nr:hypothetical protein [Alistipes sp.]